MEFLLSPDESDIVALAYEAMAAHIPVSRLREKEERPCWVALGDAGWLHASLSGELDIPVLAAIARDAGRFAGIGQFVANAWTIPQLIASAADRSASSAWLSRHGAVPGAVVGLDPRQTPTVAGLVSGFDLYVLESRRADHMLSRVDHAVLDATPVGGLSVGAAHVRDLPGADATIPLSLSDEQAARTRSVARLLTAAGCTGLASELVASTVAHVSSREQFGQAIGRFQAVKHLLADAYSAAEVAWLAVLYAAADGGDVAGDHADLLARRALVLAGQTSSQLQGAMGFTWESDLHFLLKAALDCRVTTTDATVVARRSGYATMGH